MYETLENADKILNDRLPSVNELDQFPLNDYLRKLDLRGWTGSARAITLNYGAEVESTDLKLLEKKLKGDNRLLEEESIREIYRQHIRKTMEGIRILTGKQTQDICLSVGNWGISPFKDIHDFWLELNDEENRFLRFVAFYHDIGKAIHRDRHPTLGNHLLESLSDEDTRQLIAILNEDRFFKMKHLIAYHDLFGVLCTGEASRPVLIDAAGLSVSSKIIGYIATLNLADIYGTIPNITSLQFKDIAEDWQYVTNLIDNTEYRSDLEKTMIQDAQQPENTAERIRRLIATSILRSSDPIACRIEFGSEDNLSKSVGDPNILKQLLLEKKVILTNPSIIEGSDNESWHITDNGIKMYVAKKENIKSGFRLDFYFSNYKRQDFTEKITNSMILETLAKRLGPELTFFCSDFALLCKLDYALRFLARLATKWIERELKNTSGMPENVSFAGLADIVVELLARLVTNYRDLTYQRYGSRRRVGLELMGLTRANEISDRVIELLLGTRRIEGVNWVADEVTTYYFI